MTSAPAHASWLVRLVFVTLLVGVGAGIAGMAASFALHGIEHLVYGFGEGTFLDDLPTPSSGLKVLALASAGVVGGIGWWALRRWGRPVVPVEQAVEGRRMPVLVTLGNVALQIVIVGLGASIGREVAPRELAALVAQWITRKTGVTARETRILVACGAGAGLAAVYDVPLAGAVFAVEILLAELSIATIIPALATSAIAALVARLVTSAAPLYSVPPLELSPSLIVWSVLVGPVIGFAALAFVVLIKWAGARRPKNWLILVVMPVLFTLVGVISIWLPDVLGNGRALGQLSFAATASLGFIALTVVAKLFTTTVTIGAGAAGGTLQPALALGAGIGAVLGGLWLVVWPGSGIAAFAFVAAAAFLSASMKAPLTALVLVVEFTGQGLTLLVPTLLAIGGSVAVSYMVDRRRRLIAVD
ncbi:H(+)/Cl(-) exchange transporter ClcA [Frondihabitans sp. 762G35]|uniref:chloride channel protein n=1 Tax=Frondihabitans sp. 762G35 TaxID=1446794 RepID=UPI000D2203BE|nr:chloride channel protein [Frondihabitans sp. 762G35]ARC58421.1 H(+)/Cl(-) exchange transporter ClcA [Frondihabitans sp. 762G35]